jgi:hypothetical protein
MTMLFRPSVRRANSRLKQSSILHLFGKKWTVYWKAERNTEYML